MLDEEVRGGSEGEQDLSVCKGDLYESVAGEALINFTIIDERTPI